MFPELEGSSLAGFAVADVLEVAPRTQKVRELIAAGPHHLVSIAIRPLHPHTYPRNRAENGNAAFLRSE